MPLQLCSLNANTECKCQQPKSALDAHVWPALDSTSDAFGQWSVVGRPWLVAVPGARFSVIMDSEQLAKTTNY